jgi:hypothetical protein
MLVVVLAACSGQGTDETAGGSDGSAGGSGDQDGESDAAPFELEGGRDGAAHVCPAAEPTPGTACEGALNCYYGFHYDCDIGGAEIHFVCENGVWTEQLKNNSCVSCPHQKPEVGTLCEVEIRCYYWEEEQCPNGATESVVTVCKQGVWENESACCPDAAPEVGSPCSVLALVCDFGGPDHCEAGSTGSRYVCENWVWKEQWSGACSDAGPLEGDSGDAEPDALDAGAG